MIKKESRKIEIDAAIALCNVLEGFEEFNRNAKDLLMRGNNITITYRLNRIATGEKIKSPKGSEATIKFYLQNTDTIEEIQKYLPIDNFLLQNYTQDGNMAEESCVKNLYEYLNKHKDRKDEILELLYKVKDLGFTNMTFDETLDFTNSYYDLKEEFAHNNSVTYFDNIKVIPNYNYGTVEYKTTGSNYKMTLKTSYFDISKYDRTIAFNSLLFDHSNMPKEITKQSTFDSIISLKEEHKDTCKEITNSVNLSVKVDDLYDQLVSLNEVVETLSLMTQRKEIKSILVDIEEQLKNLKNKSEKYNESITNEKSNITIEGINKQKVAYLKRREWSKEDCC